MSVFDHVPIDVILNCILVNENIRPAMLIQPADYKEATHHDAKTKYIITEIKKLFPEFVMSSVYQRYQGVIVSKHDYNDRTDVSLEEMGKILGYPCYEGFDSIDDNNVSYTITIYVKSKNNEIELLSNKCSDETNLEKYKNIADKAKKVFEKEEYKEMLSGFEVADVSVESLPTIPTQIIINKLLKNASLNKNEMDKVQNILFNLGFGIELQLYFLGDFQYNNPVHRGILLDLLLKDKHDVLKPFVPLQNYPVQSTQVDSIIQELESDLLNVLSKSELQKSKRKSKSKRKKKSKSKRISNKKPASI